MKTSTTPALINVSMTVEDLREICSDIAGDIQGVMPLLTDSAPTVRNFRFTVKAWRAHSPFYVSKREGVPHKEDTEGYRAFYDSAADRLERLIPQLEAATAKKKRAA